MFDFAWSEIAIIAAVALVAIGPKDMPVAIRTVAGLVKKARRMAAEFQTHVDEMVKEADLADVKKSFNEIRNFDLKGVVEKHLDPDNSLRDAFAGEPFASVSSEPGLGENGEPEAAAEPPLELYLVELPPRAPAFIPPNLIPPAPAPATIGEAEGPPAFIPPHFAERRPSA